MIHCYVFLSFSRLDELKKDFEEYQEDSKTLEIELDTQIKQTEQKNKDLTATISRLQNDNENIRVCNIHYHKCDYVLYF